jgi:hypothetical protein
MVGIPCRTLHATSHCWFWVNCGNMSLSCQVLQTACTGSALIVQPCLHAVWPAIYSQCAAPCCSVLLLRTVTCAFC